MNIRNCLGNIVGFACLLFTVMTAASCASVKQTNTNTRVIGSAHLTHGPILGRVGSSQIGIWARSNYPATMQVMYGLSAEKLDKASEKTRTSLGADNTAWVLLTGLEPGTSYFYAVTIDGNVSDHGRGTFRTLPGSRNEFRDTAQSTPGFSFAATSCGKQSDAESLIPYRTMFNKLGNKVDFTMQLGDWLYETDRDWPVAQWQANAVPPGKSVPDIVANAPNLVGVWQNYKTYLDNDPFRAAWHRNVPSFFAFDDHEILNNFTDAARVGSRQRASLFRDPGQQGWLDYLGWSNPRLSDRQIVFGRTRLAPGDPILFDPDADFSNLNPDDETTLHIHWGGPLAGARYDSKTKRRIAAEIDAAGPQDPNAGVYRIVRVLDQHRLQLHPTPQFESSSGYSIGVKNYYKFKVSNAEFFVLDTRSYRQMANKNAQHRPEILGDAQMAWLKDSMRDSSAKLLFVVSPVSFSLPHLESITAPVNDSSWTGFIDDRQELLDFWASLEKMVIIVAGDMHNSYSIQWNERLWEFGAGPFGSNNRENSAKTGWRPARGEFNSAGQLINIRWSTFFKNGTPASDRRQPVYAVFRVNSPGATADSDVMSASSEARVTVSFFDALNGDLLHAETIATDIN